MYVSACVGVSLCVGWGGWVTSHGSLRRREVCALCVCVDELWIELSVWTVETHVSSQQSTAVRMAAPCASASESAERAVEASGCADALSRLEECLGEHGRDWTKCQLLVAALKGCKGGVPAKKNKRPHHGVSGVDREQTGDR